MRKIEMARKREAQARKLRRESQTDEPSGFEIHLTEEMVERFPSYTSRRLSLVRWLDDERVRVQISGRSTLQTWPARCFKELQQPQVDSQGERGRDGSRTPAEVMR